MQCRCTEVARGSIDTAHFDADRLEAHGKRWGDVIALEGQGCDEVRLEAVFDALALPEG